MLILSFTACGQPPLPLVSSADYLKMGCIHSKYPRSQRGRGGPPTDSDSGYMHRTNGGGNMDGVDSNGASGEYPVKCSTNASTSAALNGRCHDGGDRQSPKSGRASKLKLPGFRGGSGGDQSNGSTSKCECRCHHSNGSAPRTFKAHGSNDPTHYCSDCECRITDHPNFDDTFAAAQDRDLHSMNNNSNSDQSDGSNIPLTPDRIHKNFQHRLVNSSLNRNTHKLSESQIEFFKMLDDKIDHGAIVTDFSSEA